MLDQTSVIPEVTLQRSGSVSTNKAEQLQVDLLQPQPMTRYQSVMSVGESLHDINLYQVPWSSLK